MKTNQSKNAKKRKWEMNGFIGENQECTFTCDESQMNEALLIFLVLNCLSAMTNNLKVYQSGVLGILLDWTVRTLESGKKSISMKK